MDSEHFSYLSLNELCSKIKSAVDAHFSGVQYWVVGEIAGFSDSRGHCYITFIEKSANKSTPDAEIKAIIFKSKYQQIKTNFESQTGSKLRENIRILFSTTVNFDAKYGISLIVNDIEPSYTIGLMQMERKQIIEKLKAEGIYEKNKSLKLPEVIQHIAVLSAADSRGYLDFKKKLLLNNQRFSFNINLFSVALQGENASKETVNQLIQIFNSGIRYDAVLIVRGGGGNANLDCFNNYAMARAIARFPIPVITGIGHVTDLSVADEVANIHRITPTDAANFLLEHNDLFVQKIDNTYSQIIGHLSYITSREMQQNQNMVQRLQSAVPTLLKEKLNTINFNNIRLSSQTTRLTDSNRHQLKAKYVLLNNYSKDLLRAKKNNLQISTGNIAVKTERMSNHFRNKLNIFKELISNKPKHLIENHLLKNESVADKIRILDPINILKRGYSITLYQGKVLKSIHEVEKGEIITKLFDGEIRSKIN